MSEVVKADEAEITKIETLAPIDSESTALVQVIDRALQNPDVDVEKLERMLAMQERILDREAEQAFNRAMRSAQAEMPQVVRDAYNPQTKSKYARLETVSKAMTKTVSKNGFSMSFGTADSPIDGHYRVTCIVAHEKGFSREYHGDVPTDMTGLKGNPNKTATHGFGSTMSYGRRYLKLMIFDVSMKDEDDDGNAAGPCITPEQKDELIRLMRECDGDTKKFLNHFGVDSMDQIPAKYYGKAVNALNARKPK